MSATDNPPQDDDHPWDRDPPEEDICPICPYCKSEFECEHVLLKVDLTFNETCGPLSDSFEKLWGTIYEENNAGEDEDECFNYDETYASLLEEVPEYGLYWDFEGGPGLSSSNISYYCDSAKAVKDAVAKWNSEKEKLRILEILRKCALDTRLPSPTTPPLISVCPYCGIENSCEHLLLVVDKTHRDAVGGPLADGFRKRWWPHVKEIKDHQGGFKEEEESGEFNYFLDLFEEVSFWSDDEKYNRRRYKEWNKDHQEFFKGKGTAEERDEYRILHEKDMEVEEKENYLKWQCQGWKNDSAYTSYYLENVEDKKDVVARWNSEEDIRRVLEELRKQFLWLRKISTT